MPTANINNGGRGVPPAVLIVKGLSVRIRMFLEATVSIVCILSQALSNERLTSEFTKAIQQLQIFLSNTMRRDLFLTFSRVKTTVIVTRVNIR